MNMARDWVIRSGKTVDETIDEYDGACIDFAGDFMDAIGRGRLVYFETGNNPRWKYHAAVEIDGMIHDLWEQESMPLKDYMGHIGATSLDYIV